VDVGELKGREVGHINVTGQINLMNQTNANLTIEEYMKNLTEARVESLPVDEEYPPRMLEKLNAAEVFLQYGFILYYIVTYGMCEGAGSSKCL
jgi:hypothetical protein